MRLNPLLLSALVLFAVNFSSSGSPNISAGKIPTCSGAIDQASRVTDGKTSSGLYASVAQGLQWIQIDLGANYSVDQIKLWHYYADSRAYHDVIVQISSTATFTSGVRTVFNNDSNNSAGLGAGTDAEYTETSSGKSFAISPGAIGRYVRFYSNGSNQNVWNHYVEAQVFGVPASTQLPSAPTNVQAVGGDAQVALSWSAVTGASNYRVKRSSTAGGPYGVVAGVVTATSWTDTGVQNGTKYFYIVTAVNTAGEGPASSEVAATPQAPLPNPPGAPQNLTATGGDHQVSLSWSASSGATSYVVKRGTASGGPYSVIASSVSSTSYVDTGLVNGAPYYYVVAATNAGGTSPVSNEASATPQAPIPPPPAPTNLTAQPGNAQVQLSWTAASGATSYNVKSSSTSSGPFLTIRSGVTSTDALITGLQNGTTTYFAVTGVNSAGEGPLSNIVGATPQSGNLIEDHFDGADGLITSWEYYSYGTFPQNGTSLPSNPSPTWEAGSGWLYRQNGWGYSGRPIDWQDEYFFRLNTRNFNIQDATISWNYRSAAFGEQGYAFNSADAVDVWLRYQTQYHLYAFQFDRTNNGFLAKRKIPAQGWTGPANLISNKGVYYDLITDAQQPIFGAGQRFISWTGVKSLLPASEQAKPGFPNLAHDSTTVYDFKVTVKNLPNGNVQIQAYRAGVLIYSATDDGRSPVAADGMTQGQHLDAGYYNSVPGWQPWWGLPITPPGASGFRADNIQVWFDDFVVTPLP